MSRGWMLALVLLAATITAISGNGTTLPLDSHEVYVARTTEEMLARGNMIVPYLNDLPRINKPPLCYWLVMAVNAVNGGDHVVSEWEARVPSIAAGIIMAVAAFWLGCLLFNAWTGFIGSLLLASSSGYVYYTHCARPEMVYAALCTLGMVGFAIADRYWLAQRAAVPPPTTTTTTRSAAAIASLSGWMALGLATMAKGPQLPLMIVTAWVIALLTQRRGGDILRVLRPLTGLMLVAAITAWWYVAIARMIPEAQRAIENETLSRIFDSRESWTRYLDPYYIYRTVGLALPWVLLYPLALVLPWLKEWRSDRSMRLLGLLVNVPLVALHVSLGRRWYYMLPALAPLTLLMARVAITAGRACCESGRTWLWAMLAGAHIAGFVIGLFIYSVFDGQITAPPPTAIAAILVASLIMLALLATRRATSGFADWSLGSTVGFGVVFFAVASFHGSPWGEKRFDRRDFALEVASLVPPDATLLGVRPDWEVEQFYLHRVIPEAQGPRGLDAPHAGDLWMLTEERFNPRLPRGWSSVVEHEARGEDDELLQLRRIVRPGN